jgi:IclR family acetate operon transcriptional repressor
MQKATEHDQRLNVLGKALAVLEAVADHPQGIGLPDLAARLGMPRDKARERFTVGQRLTRLSLSALVCANRWAPVREVLQDLVNEVGETCNLGVLDGLDYVYIERIECEWPLRIHLEVGNRAPAHCLSGGKVLLAHLDPKHATRLLKSRKLLARTPNTITRVADLEAELEKVRERGYGVNNQENFDGIVAIAVPVLDGRNNNVVAALTMHGPVSRLSLKACEDSVPRLKEVAQRISEAWGLT